MNSTSIQASFANSRSSLPKHQDIGYIPLLQIAPPCEKSRAPHPPLLGLNARQGYTPLPKWAKRNRIQSLCSGTHLIPLHSFTILRAQVGRSKVGQLGVGLLHRSPPDTLQRTPGCKHWRGQGHSECLRLLPPEKDHRFGY